MASKTCICCIVSGIIIIILAIFMTGLILSQTVFKPKHPILQTVSSTVDGIKTNLNPPQLNFTLTLEMQIENPNLADFKYTTVENSVYYRGKLVGNLTLPSSTLPAKGSALLPCPLVLQFDKLIVDIGDLFQDMLQRKIVIETKANMPGEIIVLGIFKAHMNSLSHCNLVLSFPRLEVEKQVCELDAKL